ncbi:MAG: hypothetical protein L6290_12810, partial [Thermodesulfovibrionales bacterium]|nr:hypothetical protein [Thermodesulfovibrionales bacterium]
NAPFRTPLYWKRNKKRILVEFLNKVEKIIPGIQKHVLYLDGASPATLYKYTLNYKGAAYGWAATPSQLFQPIFMHKSFIKGLYLTGHWTTKAHGIPGVIYLGYDTAQLILKNERIKSEEI